MTPELRRRIKIRDHYTCQECGKYMPDEVGLHIDHIIPVAKGGHPSDLANLQLAHMTCNRDKSDKLVAQKQDFSGGIELVSNRLLPLTFDWKTI